MPSRFCCTSIVGLVVLGTIPFFGTQARADSYFTTQDDWSQWISASSGITPSATPTGDTDGAVIDGIGNVSSPGQVGAAGGLTISITPGQGFGGVVSPSENANAPFLSSFSNSSFVQLDYTIPTTPGTYFQPLLLLNYDGNYNPIVPSGSVNQGSFYTATYSLPSGLPSAPSGALTYFQVGVIANTDYSGNYTIDSLRSPAVVPSNERSLFTSQTDWNQWGSSDLSLSSSPAADTDTNTTNGIGNTSTPGQLSTVAGLSVTVVSGQTFSSFSSPDEHNNTAFLATLASATKLKMDFTDLPYSGGYFEPVLLLNYDGHYDQIDPDSIDDEGAFNTATYTLPAGLPTDSSSLSYFQLGFIANTNETGSFDVDNVRVELAPEPTSILGLAVLGTLMVRRRR